MVRLHIVRSLRALGYLLQVRLSRRPRRQPIDSSASLSNDGAFSDGGHADVSHQFDSEEGAVVNAVEEAVNGDGAEIGLVALGPKCLLCERRPIGRNLADFE